MALPQPSRDVVLSSNNEENNRIDSNATILEDFCNQPPQQVTIKTAHGDTAVLVYNSDATDTIVITHGCGGKKEQFHEGRMAQRLASRFRVVTFDWYGHGESPPCPADYCKEQFLEQLDRVVEEFIPDGQRFHLYGFSMGCFLSLHYCALHRHRVNRLVLHSPWNAEMSVFAPGTKTAAKIPLVGIAGMAVIRHFSFPYCHNAATFKKIILTLGEGAKAWNDLLNIISQHPQLKVLVICGEGERPFHHVAQEIHGKLQISRFRSYPTAHHMTWSEKWDQPVGSFFRDNIFDFFVKQEDT